MYLGFIRRSKDSLRVFLGVIAASVACSTTQQKIESPSESNQGRYIGTQTSRRIDFFKLDPALDQEKPVGIADYGSWITTNDLLLGSMSGNWLSAVALPSLKPRWFKKASSTLTCPPGSFGNLTLFGLQDGKVMALSTRNGELMWEQTLDTFPARQFRKVGEQVLVVTASQTIYSLEQATGKVLWVYDSDAIEGIKIRTLAGPSVHDGRVYFGISSGEIIALDLATGKKAWSHSLGQSSGRFVDVVGEIHIVNRTLIATRYDGVIGAVDIHNLKLKVWKNEVKISSITDNSFRNGRLFVGTDNGYVYSFNPTNGAQQWKKQLGTSITTLTAGESTLYASSLEGKIHALSIGSGDILWHDNLAAPVVSPPVYFANKIYFQTGLQNFYGYAY